ncbi:MAG TPA: cytochrome C oxidase subunit IV family protein [Spirochaetia bacterium]|nr:cytochrome C oxidase subunit IV family protein [Spirochaetia bacterium]
MTHSESHTRTHYLRYVGVWAALIAFTVLTVTTASLNVGRIGIIIVLAIAAAKSTLVLLWFMHLSTEKRLILKLLVPIALCVLAIFIGLTYTDVLYR